MKGNDGLTWVVKAGATGVRRWVRATGPSPRPRSDRAGPRRAAREAAGPRPPSARDHTLLFCEPVTLREIRGNPGVKFIVDDALYPVLLRAPKAFHVRRSVLDVGNAYRFGPRRPLSEYRFVGYHGNDAAQTGFIDLDLFTAQAQAELPQLARDKYRSKRFDWADRSALKAVRARVPHVLWLGETVGGDVGASLWAHRSKNRLDSIIVDNNYFFPERPASGRRPRRRATARARPRPAPKTAKAARRPAGRAGGAAGGAVRKAPTKAPRKSALGPKPRTSAAGRRPAR